MILQGSSIPAQTLKDRYCLPIKDFVPDHIDHRFSMLDNVRLLDSTSITLHPSLVKVLPGARNQTGRQSATMKIQLCYNLTSGILDALSISPYTRNDQKASADIFTIAKTIDSIVIRKYKIIELQTIINAIELKSH